MRTSAILFVMPQLQAAVAAGGMPQPGFVSFCYRLVMAAQSSGPQGVMWRPPLRRGSAPFTLRYGPFRLLVRPGWRLSGGCTSGSRLFCCDLLPRQAGLPPACPPVVPPPPSRAPSHTNVLFDLVFPAGYTGDKDARLAEMCNFVKEQDPKYCCVIKVEQSYASAPPEEEQ